MTTSVVREVIQGWISSKIVRAIWIGVPCATWSLARRGHAGRPGGPIRTLQYIYGLPRDTLSEKDQKKIVEGNRTMRAACFVIRLCIKHTTPVALENPNSSRIWHAPELEKLLKHDGAVSHHFDYCCYGVPWKKSTPVAGWLTGECAGLQRVCTGKLGLCSSGKFHTILRGVKPGTTMLWTHIAEPYPPRVAALAANWIVTASDHFHLNRLCKLAKC